VGNERYPFLVRKRPQLVLELDASTAAEIRQLEIDCSSGYGSAGLFSINLPVVFVTPEVDRECFVRGVRNLLGDHVAERLSQHDWQFKTIVLPQTSVRHVELSLR
jgi:hypothetical protein